MKNFPSLSIPVSQNPTYSFSERLTGMFKGLKLRNIVNKYCSVEIYTLRPNCFIPNTCQFEFAFLGLNTVKIIREMMCFSLSPLPLLCQIYSNKAHFFVIRINNFITLLRIAIAISSE